jgi:lysophospholipase L1-like esterase
MPSINSHSTKSDGIRFTVIGDSAAFGTGDTDEMGNPRGWGYYLSQVFHGSCQYLNFSRPGAKSTEVKEVQLPKALEANPDICAVIVGGNDMLRNGFDPKVLYRNITDTCHDLIAKGSEIIMVELHDPGEILRVPRLLKRVIRRRVNAVNKVYYQVAEELNVILIRTRSIPNVHDLTNWHIDRMHPGPKGHQLLAREMAQALRQRGWRVELPDSGVSDPHSRAAKIWWLICKGTPWFLKRSVDLLPVAIILMVAESFRVIFEWIAKGYSAVTDLRA